MPWIHVNRKGEEQVINSGQKHRIHKKKKGNLVFAQPVREQKWQTEAHHAQLHGDRWNSRIHVLCQAQDNCQISQDVPSSFLCSSPEKALVKSSAKKQFRIEAASLRIFARAIKHCYIDYLPQAQNTGHPRLNTLSLVLLRFENRRKRMYLPEKTCLQSTLDLFEGLMIHDF